MSRIKSEEENKFESWLSDVKSGYDDGDDASNSLSLTLQGSPLTWKGGVLVVMAYGSRRRSGHRDGAALGRYEMGRGDPERHAHVFSNLGQKFR